MIFKIFGRSFYVPLELIVLVFGTIVMGFFVLKYG